MAPNPLQPDLPIAGPEWLPLAQDISVRMLQERLAGLSSPEVLAQLGQWLAELVLHEGHPLEHWVDAIEQVDRLAGPHQLRLVPQQLETRRLYKLCESGHWLATQAYWQQLGASYLRCLLRCASSGDGDLPHTGLASLPVRLMRNLARQHKSLLLASKQVEQRIWRDLGQAYLLAEGLGLADAMLRQEMLKPLMLAVAAPDALPPIQLHVAERLAACLAGHFSLGTRPGPGCCFCFEPGLQRPPMRAQDSTSPAPQQRFFGAGSAIQALQGLAGQLHQRGNLPPKVALGGEFPPADILAAIEHLERQWADIRPARRDEREAGSTWLTVLPGLMPALNWLARQKADGGLAPHGPARTECWNATDRSERGFGTTLPHRPPAWLSVGALMAVLPEAGTAVRMAIVRRITAARDDCWRIGAELLGQQAARVTLHPDLPRQDCEGIPAGQAAILLSPSPDRTDMAELLLPAGILENAASLQMQLESGSYRLESPATIGQDRDYRQVRYRLDHGG